MEYHDIKVYLEVSLNIMDPGILWNSVEYHDDMVCLGISLNVMQYHGMSWNIETIVFTGILLTLAYWQRF